MTSTKNLPDILQKIQEGTAPDKFTVAHLKSIGFKSSNDTGVIPLLKDLGFLTPDGLPTKRYHEFRDTSKSKKVLGKAILEAYEDIFHVNENPSEADRKAIEGKFKSVHNSSKRVAKEQTRTFLALLNLADIDAAREDEDDEELDEVEDLIEEKTEDENGAPEKPIVQKQVPHFSGLRYNIEVHLPPTKDVEVYNAIFKSLKEHLLDD